jgi:hypothetical protein
MDIINPFEELVVFGKRLPLEPMSSTVIGALHPTGKHVGHGQDLGHFRGPKSGGKAGHLERYTTKVRGLRQGPFKKGLVPVAAKGTVQNSLNLISKIPKPTTVPNTVTTSPRLANAAAKAGTITNSNIPHAAKQGNRL